MNKDDLPAISAFRAPILRFSKDEKEHSLKEIREEMCKIFNLTEKHCNLLTPNGKTTRINVRTQEAIKYLVQTKLLSRPRKDHLKITDTGKEILKILDSFP